MPSSLYNYANLIERITMVHMNRNDTVRLLRLLYRLDDDNYVEHAPDIMRRMFSALGVEADVELLDEWLAPKTKLYMTTRIVSKSAPENAPTSSPAHHPEHTSDTSPKMVPDSSCETISDMTREAISDTNCKTISETIPDMTSDMTQEAISDSTPKTTAGMRQTQERNDEREKNDETVARETAPENVCETHSEVMPKNIRDTSDETYSDIIAGTCPDPSEETIAGTTRDAIEGMACETFRAQDEVVCNETDSTKSSPADTPPPPVDDPFGDHADDCADDCFSSSLEVVHPMRQYVSTIPILDHTMRIEYDAQALHAGMLPNLIGTLAEELSGYDAPIAFSRFFFRSLILANGYDFDFAQTPDDMPTLTKNIAFLLVSDRDFAEALYGKISS